jgi:hypothetical protein
MASIISTKTSGGGGIAVTGDTSGVLELQSANGTTAVTIDASQNVGIGTSSPTFPLSIEGSNASEPNIGITLTNSQSGAALFAVATGTSFSAAGWIGVADGVILRSGNNTSGGLALTTGAAAPLILGTNNTERMRIDSGGVVFINTTTRSNSAVLNVAGTVSASLTGRIYSIGTYNNTTASGANMHIASDGHIFRSTSSIKYKTEIQDTTHGLDKVMELRSVTYKGINDGDTVFGGLIAEEVHEAGLTEFVQYAEDGSPDALAYGQMVALAFKAIQEQQAIITELKARIEVLENSNGID